MLDLKQLTIEQRVAYLEAKVAVLELRINMLIDYLRELVREARPPHELLPYHRGPGHQAQEPRERGLAYRHLSQRRRRDVQPGEAAGRGASCAGGTRYHRGRIRDGPAVGQKAFPVEPHR